MYQLLRSATFGRAATLLADTLAQNVGLPFQAREGPPGLSGDPFGSRITLTDAHRGVSVEVRVAATRASARIAAEAIFGDPSFCDEDAVRDALQELANAIMGVLQAELRAEGWELTAGLPVRLPPEELARLPESGTVHAFHADDATIFVVLAPRPVSPARLRARELRDGMILAAPVRAGPDEAIGKTGARITQVFIERLLAIDPELLVELCDARVG